MRHGVGAGGDARRPAPRAGRCGWPISFPDCWDGEHLDSPDHVAHMARSVGGACPDSHPVVMPQLLLAITYPVTGDGHDLSLASGSLITGHADFFNAWDEDKLRTEVELVHPPGPDLRGGQQPQLIAIPASCQT